MTLPLHVFDVLSIAISSSYPDATFVKMIPPFRCDVYSEKRPVQIILHAESKREEKNKKTKQKQKQKQNKTSKNKTRTAKIDLLCVGGYSAAVGFLQMPSTYASLDGSNVSCHWAARDM